MTASLVLRGPHYYWRIHLAVVGVPVVLAGAARDLAYGVARSPSSAGSGKHRLSDRVVRILPRITRERWARQSGRPRTSRTSSRWSSPTPSSACRRGPQPGQVRVYGVDDRFWRFHRSMAFRSLRRDAYISPALAAQIGASADSVILVRVASDGYPARVSARTAGQGRPDAAPDRARGHPRRSSVSSRSTRSRATCAPCSCRSRDCKRTSSEWTRQRAALWRGGRRFRASVRARGVGFRHEGQARWPHDRQARRWTA